jgi:hypothetical protein
MPTNLCHGLPVEFATFLEYSHSLCFQEIPDYKYIIDLFKGLLLREGLENAMVFDWDRAESATEQHQDQVNDCIGQCKCNQPKHCQG